MTVTAIFSVSVLLILSALTEIISRFTRLPLSILLVIVGFFFSLLAEVDSEIFYLLANFKIHPDIILYACLPTLIFQSAYALDTGMFKHNIAPILMLAIPGLFLSTFLIGGIVHLFTSFDFLTSLLLGAILSATDPVAVISLFKQLGVPRRLTVLVEGESLLNDSTAIVTVKTILFVMAAGTITSETYFHGAFEFVYEFFGGILAGYLITWLAGTFIRLFQEMPITQLSLTVILAYLSFLIADHVLNVSGVMATITAGLLMSSGWGKAKLSAEADKYVANLLVLLAYIANAFIFLLMGFTIYHAILKSTFSILAVAIVAVLISRAAVIYGLIPFVNKLQPEEPIDRGYQTIMWWGGLRGAIALAIVFGLSALPDQEVFISVVMGVVIFTILVQGFSINQLIARLKLNKRPLIDRVVELEAELIADRSTVHKIFHLERGGFFSMKVIDEIRSYCKLDLDKKQKLLEKVKSQELDTRVERKLLFLSCFASEKHFFSQLFFEGHLNEEAYLALNRNLDSQIDLMRYHEKVSGRVSATPLAKFFDLLSRAVRRFIFFNPLSNSIEISSAVTNYEVQWSLHQGTLIVQAHLNEMAEVKAISTEILDEVKMQYKKWEESTKRHLDRLGEKFPEFVSAMQHRLAKRVFIHSKFKEIERLREGGMLPVGAAERIMHHYLQEIKALNQVPLTEFTIVPQKLIRKIPFLKDIENQELEEIVKLLRERKFMSGDFLLDAGSNCGEVYFILQGVVRVIEDRGEGKVEVGTLLAGDFFGEEALLSDTESKISCKAMTGCVVYILDSKEFKVIRARFPSIDRLILAEVETREKGEEQDKEKVKT